MPPSIYAPGEIQIYVSAPDEKSSQGGPRGTPKLVSWL